MSNPIKSILDDFPVVILDGALATELEKKRLQLKRLALVSKNSCKQP